MSISTEGSEQDFDLNIAPIIDCFTVLIAYLLISASFVSMGFFDVGVSTTSEVTTPTQPLEPQEFMSVELGPANALVLHLRGPETSSITVPAKSGTRDYDALLSAVSSAKSRWPNLTDASVTADSRVQYREVIRAIEALKKQMPKVFVGE